MLCARGLSYYRTPARGEWAPRPGAPRLVSSLVPPSLPRGRRRRKGSPLAHAEEKDSVDGWADDALFVAKMVTGSFVGGAVVRARRIRKEKEGRGVVKE